MKKSKKLIVVLLLAAGGVCGGYLYLKPASQAPQAVMEYAVTEMKPGNLSKTIVSTGTVEPEELVNVGAQIGGMIEAFGKDSNGNQVDFRSPVKAGQVLAKIDDSLYRAEVEIARAQKLQAEAKLKSAEATQKQSCTKYDLAKSNWDRAVILYKRGIQAKSEYDSTKAEYDSAMAAKTISDAAVLEAQAQIASSAATLKRCERNLEYCVITSPVDGIIIDRRVNLGQTVNASMNAPSLFLIAKDLKRMQVWVSVNEADIGELKPGLKVQFTVDAFDKRTFVGTVKKIRLNATMSQNVVTYVVEIDTDNSDGTLLPYLTANVKIILAERKDVLSVPNAALRFSPDGIVKENTVWIQDETGAPVPRIVATGLNDGSHTEILSGLAAGEKVITGKRIVQMQGKKPDLKAKTEDGNSPFMPKPPKMNTKGSKAPGAPK